LAQFAIFKWLMFDWKTQHTTIEMWFQKQNQEFVDMEFVFLLFIIIVGGVVWLITKSSTTKSDQINFPSNDLLPNRYSRKDYYNKGFSNSDIELGGLDQPGAPDPHTAGWVMWDMADGNMDGDIDF
jgi:hypothetical protein